MNIDITASPYRLDALEEMCRVARQQCFPDGAEIRISGSTLTIRSSAEALASAERPGIGDPWSAPGLTGSECAAESDDEFGYVCCLADGHRGPHIAGNGSVCVAVWA